MRFSKDHRVACTVLDNNDTPLEQDNSVWVKEGGATMATTSLETDYAKFEAKLYKKLAEIEEWNEFSATLEAANTQFSVVPEYPHALVLPK